MSLSKSLVAVSARKAAERTIAQEQKRSEAGLDWFSFFCANLQTGFGPFVSVYLTTEKWSQTDIGLVLMIGGLIGLLGQVPGGALVDRMRSKTLMAAAAVVMIGISALLVACGSVFALILFAWILHAAASTVLSPSISSVSLELAGHAGVSRRLGRNATFASVGNAMAAGGMGACGYYVSNQAVFFVTAALAVPALLSLFQIKMPRRRPGQPSPSAPVRVARASGTAAKTSFWTELAELVRQRAFVVFGGTIVLYYLSNAAMLPLVGSMLTLRSAASPTIFIAACIVVPQIVVALVSPLVGVKAQSWGRRPLLILALLALPIRGVLLGVLSDPHLIVVAQLLDGITSAVFGVILPLTAADLARRHGHFALLQGLLGTAMGLGASFSATLAGVLADRFNTSVAFFGLASIGLAALLLSLVAMPETREI